MVVDAFHQYNERGHLQSISVSHSLLVNAFFLHARHNLSQKHKSANRPKTAMIKMKCYEQGSTVRRRPCRLGPWTTPYPQRPV